MEFLGTQESNFRSIFELFVNLKEAVNICNFFKSKMANLGFLYRYKAFLTRFTNFRGLLRKLYGISVKSYKLRNGGFLGLKPLSVGF